MVTRLMKRAALSVGLLLLGALQCFGSSNLKSVTSQNQLHFAPSGKRAATAHNVVMGQTAAHKFNQPGASANALNGPTGRTQSAAKRASVRPHTANPPVGKIGFVSATQFPAGGETHWTALEGDFNGDGKKDVATIVETYVSSTYTYSISILLGNGDGTFQAPVLTPIANNDSNVQIVVGDLNGDGKSD